MTAAELLRRAADNCESYVVSAHDERVFKLMALHIARRCGGHSCDEEARLLIELLG